MYCITNKELRHLKAVLRGAIESYEYDYDYCINRDRADIGGCPRCKKVKAAAQLLRTLKPNA
jgi:hypothetical protein